MFYYLSNQKKKVLMKLFIFIMIVSTVFEFLIVAAKADAIKEVDKFKKWTITFSQPMDFSEESLSHVIVKDNNGNKVKGISIEHGVTDKIMIVNPPISGYEDDKIYTLTTDNGIKAKNGKKLKSGRNITFKIKSSNELPTYSLKFDNSLPGLTIVRVHLNTSNPLDYNVYVNEKQADYSKTNDSFNIPFEWKDGQITEDRVKIRIEKKDDTEPGVISISYILSIPDITVKINQNDTFSLPKTVEAIMSDNSKEQDKVVWDKTTVDTSKEGSFTYYGTVEGYNKKVKLTLVINQDILNPKKPTGLKLNLLSNNDIEIQWDNVGNVDGYYVYYSDSKYGNYYYFGDSDKKNLLQWKSGYSAKLTNNGKNAIVYFKITSVKNGVESDFSDIVSIITGSGSEIQYFPLMSYVPQPIGETYDFYRVVDDDTVFYFYSMSNVKDQDFIEDYIKILKTDGWKYFQDPKHNGDSTMWYIKNGKAIGIEIMGKYITIYGFKG